MRSYASIVPIGGVTSISNVESRNSARPENTKNAATKSARNMSGENLIDLRSVVHVEPFASRDFQTPRIQSKTMQNGRVNIRDVMAIFDGMKSKLISHTVRDATLHAGSGQPRA